jgi:hypothetical protein
MRSNEGSATVGVRRRKLRRRGENISEESSCRGTVMFRPKSSRNLAVITAKEWGTKPGARLSQAACSFFLSFKTENAQMMVDPNSNSVLSVPVCPYLF